MAPINCNANDSSRQTHTQKRNAKTTARSSQTHTRKNERKKRSRVSPSHSHSHWWAIVPKIRTRDSHTHVCLCELFGQSIWVEETRRITEAITLLREETMEIVHTHTHTLKDALIKHGSKNWRKTKRNERQHSFDSYSSSALTRLTRGVSSLFVTLKQV